MPRDSICNCGHWTEEHDSTGCDTCNNFYGPDEAAPCLAFVLSPEQNTAEAIANRGGRHWIQPCFCALCVEDAILGRMEDDAA